MKPTPPQSPSWRSVLVLLAPALIAGCGGGARRRPDSRVAQHVGEDEQLLAVDWPSSMRADLEASAQRGLGVVAYRPGEKITVLPGCNAAATYHAATISPKEDVVRLATREQVTLALPFSAGAASKVGVDGGSEEVVDIAIIMRRQASAPALPFARSELRGDCAGATHVVTGLLRGAFVVAVRNKSDAAVSADVLGLGGQARTSSSALLAKSDGQPSACRDASDARASCDAIVKVTLRPIAGTDPLTASGDSWGKASCTDCAAECERGEMMACVSVGMSDLQRGNEANAERLFRAACDAKNGHGCAGLGMLYDPDGRDGGSYADPAKAVALYARGCDLGSLTGCKLLAFHVHDSAKFRIEEEPHARRVAKACSAGDAQACSAVASWYQAKARFLAYARRPEFAAAFDEAISWEKRYCALATPEHLARTPCVLENWTKVRASLSGP